MSASAAAQRPILLLPGPTSADAARHFFGEVYEYASYLTENYNEPTTAYITNGKLKPFAGRRVDLWQVPPRGRADSLATGPESVLRALLKLKCTVRIISFDETDEQYEPMACRVLDMPKADLLAWARAHIKAVELPPVEVSREVTGYPQDNNKISTVTFQGKRGRPRSKPDGSPPKGDQIDGNTGSVFVSWERLDLLTNQNGVPHPNLANVQKILTNHPYITGKIWYDEAHEKIFQTLFQEEPAEWLDNHDTRMAVWIQENLRLPKIGHQIVQRAVDDYARLHTRNEIREWMEGLAWDNRERLPHLMADAFGAEQNDYSAAVGRCWLVSMVARTYQPGCKVDTMPVFEGAQGIRKSSALAVLGGKWFAEMHEDITTKDFLQNLRGKMLIEISELHAFRRADIQRIKGIISCATDRYRVSYGRRAEDHPRRSVWCGTTNEDSWVQDDTGARRFWPVACGTIDLDYLHRHREDLFAEAIWRFKNGEKWWDVDPEAAKKEQDARRAEDRWTDAILHYCSGRKEITTGEILSNLLEIPLKDQCKADEMRVAGVFSAAGFQKKQAWRGRNVKIWLTIEK